MNYQSPYTRRSSYAAAPSAFAELEKQLDSLFGSLPEAFAWTGESSVANAGVPTRWYEKDDGYLVEYDLPGVEPKDVEISAEAGELKVSAKRAFKISSEQEPKTREYRRSFSLPEDVDENKIAAKLENGVLSLTLPKEEKAQPRRITIQNG